MADIRKQFELSETLLLSSGDKNMNTMKSDEPGIEDWADFKSIFWPESAFPDETCDFQQPTGPSPDGSVKHTYQVCLDALALADQAYSGSFVSNPDKNISRYNSDTLSVDETSNSSPEFKNSNQINTAGVEHSTSRSLFTNEPITVVQGSDLSSYFASWNDQFDAQSPCFNSHDRLVPTLYSELSEFLHFGKQSAEISEDKQPGRPEQADGLQLNYQPDFHEEYPKSLSIPCTYSSEMIYTDIGKKSKAGKMKTVKVNKRPVPYNIFSKSYVTCLLCGIVLSSRGHLRRHQTSHGANSSFSCTVCDCSFSRLNKLRKHFLHAHGIQLNKTQRRP